MVFIVIIKQLKLLQKKNSKCSKCDKNSQNLNQCKECNNKNEFYAKYNEKDNQYTTCYSKDSKLEGLYLNFLDKYFEKCYKLCKYCSELGNETNNKCDECISGYYFNPEVSKEKNCYEICQFNYYINSSSNQYQCTKDENASFI